MTMPHRSLPLERTGDSRPRRRLLVVATIGLLGLLLTTAAPSGAEAPQSEEDIEIVGGTLAAPGEFPYVVGLLLAGQPDNLQAQFCGGSLISNRRVLTAAHCVDSLSPSQLQVLVGTTSLTSGGQRRAVRDIHVHPGWDARTNRNDLATLDLVSPVNIFGVRVPRRNQGFAAPGTVATAAGWGSTSEGGANPTDLLKASFPILTNSVCASSYATVSPAFDAATMLCAGVLAGGVDACQGDSGGPLLVNRNATRYQVGIVSWGVGCARPGFPGVYTRLARYATDNDAFGSALRVPGDGGRVLTRNYTATREAGEPNHASDPGGASVWFNWTAPRRGPVTVNTFGSSFDTLLAVYRGPTVRNLRRVAANDDAVGRQSRVSFIAQRGTTYRIAVDGYRGDIGNVTLRLSRA